MLDHPQPHNRCLHAIFSLSVLLSLGYDTRKLTENSNRNITNLTDIKYMLLLKGVNVYEIRDVLNYPCAAIKNRIILPHVTGTELRAFSQRNTETE